QHGRGVEAGRRCARRDRGRRDNAAGLAKSRAARREPPLARSASLSPRSFMRWSGPYASAPPSAYETACRSNACAIRRPASKESSGVSCVALERPEDDDEERINHVDEDLEDEREQDAEEQPFADRARLAGPDERGDEGEWEQERTEREKAEDGAAGV